MNKTLVRLVAAVAFGSLTMPCLAAAASGNVFDGKGDSGTRVVLKSDAATAVVRAFANYQQAVHPTMMEARQGSAQISESATSYIIRFATTRAGSERTYDINKSNSGIAPQSVTGSDSGGMTLSGSHVLALSDVFNSAVFSNSPPDLTKYNIIEYRQWGVFLIGLSPKIDPTGRIFARARAFTVDLDSGKVTEINTI